MKYTVHVDTSIIYSKTSLLNIDFIAGLRDLRHSIDSLADISFFVSNIVVLERVRQWMELVADTRSYLSKRRDPILAATNGLVDIEGLGELSDLTDNAAATAFMAKLEEASIEVFEIDYDIVPWREIVELSSNHDAPFNKKESLCDALITVALDQHIRKEKTESHGVLLSKDNDLVRGTHNLWPKDRKYSTYRDIDSLTSAIVQRIHEIDLEDFKLLCSMARSKFDEVVEPQIESAMMNEIRNLGAIPACEGTVFASRRSTDDIEIRYIDPTLVKIDNDIYRWRSKGVYFVPETKPFSSYLHDYRHSDGSTSRPVSIVLPGQNESTPINSIDAAPEKYGRLQRSEGSPVFYVRQLPVYELRDPVRQITFSIDWTSRLTDNTFREIKIDRDSLRDDVSV